MAERAEVLGEMQDHKIHVIGRNLTPTGPMQERVLDKISKVQELTPQVIGVTVYLEKQKVAHRVEILYKFSHFEVFVHATGDQMYETIDLACERLMRKVTKWKEQIQSHHHKKLSEMEVPMKVLDRQRDLVNDWNDEIEEQHLEKVEKMLEPPQIVKRETKKVPMLTMAEAAMRMELCDQPFMVYRCEEDQKIKVMHVLLDGSLGVLELEA